MAAVPYDQRTTEVSGCRIDYAETGSGPMMVYLHGSGGFRFDEGSFGLLAHDFRLLVPAMPGFDQSTLGAVGNALDMADVMAAFLEAAGGGAVHLVGESFGGRIAAWLAIRHPKAVRTLILAGPAGTRQGGADLRQAGSPAEMQMRLFGRVLDPPATAEQLAQQRLNMATATRFSVMWDEDMVGQLPTIRCPALLLRGAEDHTLSREAIEEFERRIPDSKVVEIQGAPHVISAACPGQFAAAVGGFISASVAA